MSCSEKIRILVVEDNQIAQKVARIVLRSLECEVDITEDGFKALSFFGENHYDLIFMDLGLPGKDGYCVAAEIREMEAKFSLSPIPIIGLSVHTGELSRVKALKAGMNDYVIKPLTLENCRKVLKQFAAAEFFAE